jgi:hypothetical protein
MSDPVVDVQPFVPQDRRRQARATAAQLVDGLRRGLLTQGPEVFDSLRVTHADLERRRVLVEARTALLQLRPGPASFYGVADSGLVRMPVLVLAVDATMATLHCDVTRAELELRRGRDRIGVELTVRGEPLGTGGRPFTGRTINVSAGGALVDAQLEEAAAYRAVIGLPETELILRAVVIRSDDEGSALQFTGLSESATDALEVQLVRAAVRV